MCLLCSGAAGDSVSGMVTTAPRPSMASGQPGPHGQSALAPVEGGSPTRKDTAIIQSKAEIWKGGVCVLVVLLEQKMSTVRFCGEIMCVGMFVRLPPVSRMSSQWVEGRAMS